MTPLSKFFTLTGVFLIILGSFLLFERYNPKRLAFESIKVQNDSKSLVHPQKLVIPSINVNLPIIPSKIVNNKWESTSKGVSYLASSQNPGSIGNSILYGHNWSSLLGGLPKVKPGQRISIIMSSGEEKKFIVKFVSTVTPDQSNILAPTTDARITLYTCSGFLDSKRFVVTAILES